MDLEARLLESLNYLQPFRPDRIDQDIDFMRLNQERSVADPGNADLALADLWKMRAQMIAGALHEKRRDQDRGEEVAFVPVGARTQLDAGRTLVRGAVLRGLANDVPPAFFRKRNRHCCVSI